MSDMTSLHGNEKLKTMEQKVKNIKQGKKGGKNLYNVL